MLTTHELEEYLQQIRQDVCTRCVERPPGGPPCGPLGKPCGVELHLARLVESVRRVHSPMITPYLEKNRSQVCPSCPYLHSEFCPCPMDSLAVLVVEAIETVDERHPERRATDDPEDAPGVAEVTQAYQVAAGSWQGCDWITAVGPKHLNLQGWTSKAASEHVATLPAEDRADWELAIQWLTEVERRAAEAEAEAALAVAAANADDWHAAVEHARRAWMLEFSTGRSFRHLPPTWELLCVVTEDAARARGQLSVPLGVS